ncbi:hypothetical protein ACFL1R_00615 [Candidatus Latescibacterota bacterium]
MNHRIFYIFSFLLVVFTGEMVSHAISPENIAVEVYSSRTSLTIGDSLSVFCSVTIPEKVSISEPYLVDKSLFIDIEETGKTTEKFNSGITRENYSFLTYVFAVDSLTVGPFYVDYMTADGDSGKAESNVLTLAIQEVSGGSLLPNRSPFSIAFRGIPPWLIIIVIIFIAIIGVYFYFRKKKSGSIIQPSEPIDEIAEFERIRALKLYEKGHIKELYIHVSNAMRGFIHRNMNFDALYETTEEIISNISSDTVDSSIVDQIRDVLIESDMVKFAKYTPSPEYISTVIDRALKAVKNVLEKIESEREKFAAAQESALSEVNDGETIDKIKVKQTGGER